MDAQKIRQLAIPLYMVITLVRLLSVVLFAGLRLSLSSLKRIYVKNAIQNSSMKQKKYKFPEKQVSKHVIAFTGNAVVDLKNKTITTKKYKGKVNEQTSNYARWR